MTVPILKNRLVRAWAELTGSKEPRARAARSVPLRPHQPGVPREYLALHKYLEDRFANTVVLTFGQIEDLLGFALPDLARVHRDWWAAADADSTPSAQSSSWIQANRTATPNLLAGTVVFERPPA